MYYVSNQVFKSFKTILNISLEKIKVYRLKKNYHVVTKHLLKELSLSLKLLLSSF